MSTVMNTIFIFVILIVIWMLYRFVTVEKFSLESIKQMIKNVTPSKKNRAFNNLTSQIMKKNNAQPVSLSPKDNFDDTKYVPAFYKIQTNFPRLTVRKLRKFDIEA